MSTVRERSHAPGADAQNRVHRPSKATLPGRPCERAGGDQLRRSTRLRNSSKSGTVKAVSPCAGL